MQHLAPRQITESMIPLTREAFNNGFCGRARPRPKTHVLKFRAIHHQTICYYPEGITRPCWASAHYVTYTSLTQPTGLRLCVRVVQDAGSVKESRFRSLHVAGALGVVTIGFIWVSELYPRKAEVPYSQQIQQDCRVFLRAMLPQVP